MEVNGQLHAPAALPPWKSPRYPLDRRLGGPQSRFGSGGEKKNSQPLSKIGPTIIQPVAQRYTTVLTPLQEMRILSKVPVGKTEWKRPYGTGKQTTAFCYLEIYVVT
jgi:hypothetical protein